ncbi:hypothetical protein [Morganella morganii]|uniref:hypothetical protein n=1 Tax=Morganella TaxID=581 RepID=UPI00370BBC8D
MDNGPELISLTLALWAEEHGVILDFYLFRTLNEVREIREYGLREYNRKNTDY